MTEQRDEKVVLAGARTARVPAGGAMSWVRKGKVAFVASLLLSISPSPFEYEDGVMSELKAEFTNLVSKQKLQGNQRVGQRSTVARISNGYSVRAASFIRTAINVPTYRFGVSLSL